jgi:TMEM175 potassium channel family protein
MAATSAHPAQRRFERRDVEFGRSLAYIDATFAIATTLLVTTLSGATKRWSSWAAFWDAESGPLMAFAISFVVISSFWWSNHRLVASLDALSPRFVLTAVAMLAFIALLPFTTNGLGQDTGAAGEVSTVIYAVNLVAVSLLNTGLFVIAHRDGLFREPLSEADFRFRLFAVLDTSVVFLLSIPIALWVSPVGARYFWAVLIVTGQFTVVLDRRRRRA